MARAQARVVTTDAEIDAAIARGKEFERRFVPAAAVEYRPMSDVVAIRLANGVETLIPRALVQGLESATPRQLGEIELLAGGSGLRWRELDVDHEISGLLQGVYGNRRWMSAIGRQGGVQRSAAKAVAARANGRRGGRPRTKAALRDA